MSDYRRWFVPGGMLFFTVVAYDRQPILTTDAGRWCLRTAITTIGEHRPFQLFATVLLPDHWPSGDADYSTRMKRIKEEFTKLWLDAGLSEAKVTATQAKKGDRGIWQPRFWEHTIKDAEELQRCADYMHWNPRKHRLVARVRDWPWSSFHRFVLAGDYDINWGSDEPDTSGNTDWGEP